ARRISSRADTLAPLLAETLARHRRQVPLPSPWIRNVPREDAQQLPEQAIGPGAREDPSADPGDHPFVQRHETLRRELAAPGEKLMVQVDAHRADVAARSAERRREGEVGVI